MVLIFVLSSRPAPEALQDWPILLGMKLVHLLEYGVLAALWIWGLRRGTTWTAYRLTAMAVLITFLWGVSDEIHQAFVPTRTARISDAIADLVGALAVSAAWWRLRRGHAAE
jgi:VanZ family protein